MRAAAAFALDNHVRIACTYAIFHDQATIKWRSNGGMGQAFSGCAYAVSNTLRTPIGLPCPTTPHCVHLRSKVDRRRRHNRDRCAERNSSRHRAANIRIFTYAQSSKPFAHAAKCRYALAACQTSSVEFESRISPRSIHAPRSIRDHFDAVLSWPCCLPSPMHSEAHGRKLPIRIVVVLESARAPPYSPIRATARWASVPLGPSWPSSGYCHAFGCSFG